jgi:hypothetical protein
MLIDTLPDECRRSSETHIDLTCPRSIIRIVFGQRSTVGTSLMRMIIEFSHHAVRTRQMINDDLLRIMGMVEKTSIAMKTIESEVSQAKEKLVSFEHLRDETMLHLRTIAESPSYSKPFDNSIPSKAKDKRGNRLKITK